MLAREEEEKKKMMENEEMERMKELEMQQKGKPSPMTPPALRGGGTQTALQRELAASLDPQSLLLAIQTVLAGQAASSTGPLETDYQNALRRAKEMEEVIGRQNKVIKDMMEKDQHSRLKQLEEQKKEPSTLSPWRNEENKKRALQAYHHALVNDGMEEEKKGEKDEEKEKKDKKDKDERGEDQQHHEGEQMPNEPDKELKVDDKDQDKDVGKDKEQEQVGEQMVEAIQEIEKETEPEGVQQRRFLPDGREDLSGGPDAV